MLRDIADVRLPLLVRSLLIGIGLFNSPKLSIMISFTRWPSSARRVGSSNWLLCVIILLLKAISVFLRLCLDTHIVGLLVVLQILSVVVVIVDAPGFLTFCLGLLQLCFELVLKIPLDAEAAQL